MLLTRQVVLHQIVEVHAECRGLCAVQQGQRVLNGVKPLAYRGQQIVGPEPQTLQQLPLGTAALSNELPFFKRLGQVCRQRQTQLCARAIRAAPHAVRSVGRDPQANT